VKTPLWDAMGEAARAEMYAAAAARLPVGHAGEAEEVAEAYLAFMRQTYCTGQTLIVDGGGSLV
jgi:NAD(P)-dependent dehydrogenase (short-subunit alcohol dehydrogenase family)